MAAVTEVSGVMLLFFFGKRRISVGSRCLSTARALPKKIFCVAITLHGFADIDTAGGSKCVILRFTVAGYMLASVNVNALMADHRKATNLASDQSFHGSTSFVLLSPTGWISVEAVIKKKNGKNNITSYEHSRVFLPRNSL